LRTIAAGLKLVYEEDDENQDGAKDEGENEDDEGDPLQQSTTLDS